MKYRTSIVAMSLLLLGAGCQSPRAGSDVNLAQNSVFVGMDGSLTELAFDQVAQAFLLSVDVLNEETEASFTAWQETHADRYPMTDTFGHVIQLRLQGNGIQLYSAGEDGALDTADDYRKVYPLSE